MNYTQKELKDSIQLIANSIGLEYGYYAILASSPNMPSIAKMIVYDMYLHEFDDAYCSDVLAHANKILHTYVKELAINGFAEYNKCPDCKWDTVESSVVGNPCDLNQSGSNCKVYESKI